MLDCDGVAFSAEKLAFTLSDIGLKLHTGEQQHDPNLLKLLAGEEIPSKKDDEKANEDEGEAEAQKKEEEIRFDGDFFVKERDGIPAI